VVPLQINGVWHDLVALPALTDATQEQAGVDIDDRPAAALDRPGQVAAVTCPRGTVQIRGRAYVLVVTPTC
jgi:hypothetical protein